MLPMRRDDLRQPLTTCTIGMDTLKIWCPSGRGGSIPPPGTIDLRRIPSSASSQDRRDLPGGLDMATRVDQLQVIPLFSGLAPADLQFLADQMDEVSLPAGTVLITEGRGNHVLFVILEGVVDVSVGGQHRRTLGPHDFFGEISMMELDPATATVTSRTPVRAFVVSQAQFSAVKAHETVMLQLKAARSQRRRADRKLKE